MTTMIHTVFNHVTDNVDAVIEVDDDSEATVGSWLPMPAAFDFDGAVTPAAQTDVSAEKEEIGGSTQPTGDVAL